MEASELHRYQHVRGKLLALSRTLPKAEYDKLESELSTLVRLLNGTEVAVSRQTQSERIKITEKTQGFDWKSTAAAEYFEKKGWNNLQKIELGGIIEIVVRGMSHVRPIKVDREVRRRKSVMLAWFDRNFEEIRPYLDNITLRY